jgi:site-specific recombinase XerD
MILGRGTAQTDQALVAEYQQFLLDHYQVKSVAIQHRLQEAPRVMLYRIGKPIAQWTDDDITALYLDRSKATYYPYSAFLAFLFFRGYRRATLSLLLNLPLNLSRQFRSALAPYRQRIQQARTELRYATSAVGTELNLLIYLLTTVGKPLSDLNRADFDTFRDQYQRWYRQNRGQGRPNSRLTRIETYLVHWGVIPKAQIVYRHQVYFAQLRHDPIRAAILAYMQWAEVKYQNSTIHTRRAALITFFLWFQDHYPDCARLDQVTRSVALAYAQHLKRQTTADLYSNHYATDLYRSVRLFFEFAINERLETSPDRNPFTGHDLPRKSDPVPRYLSDNEIRRLLTYCNNNTASLKERTLVITLLHTGIRAAELAALKSSDIVQIQGKWKLHIHQGKGLKDRVIPLTPLCVETLQAWQAHGWEQINDFLFTHHGKPWNGGSHVGSIIRALGQKLGLTRLTSHRFRHTFAVALLNYGIRESALQKLMGHATLGMTLEYARILDRTVEQAFNTAVDQMQLGAHSWVPNFFKTPDYTLFVEGDAISWIRLPHGYCRRNPKLHCESDVKCLLCDRFCASPADLPRLHDMHDRFIDLQMPVKADVVKAHLIRLQAQTGPGPQGPSSQPELFPVSANHLPGNPP